MIRALTTLMILAGLACASRRVGAEEEAIARVLDDWHAAAAAADETRYFAHFAADGIFLGTDPHERWTAEQFRAYAHPYFARGQGWTYLPRDRQIRLSPGGSIAWFDEALDSPKYGELRGCGVLRLEVGAWKLVHYSMTFTIPNSKTASVLAVIRDQPGGDP